MLGAALYPPIMTIGPKIEARFNPVMRYPAVLETVLEETSYTTRISGHTYRLRDCDFVSLEWFFGTRESGRASGVRVDFLEKPKIRPTGRMEFGPWDVHVPIDQLTGNTYANAVHQCYIYRHESGTDENGQPIYSWPIIPMPWRTVSPFY